MKSRLWSRLGINHLKLFLKMKASIQPYLFFLSFIHTCIHDANQIDALNEKTFHNNNHQTKSDLIIIYPKTRIKRSLRNAKTGSTHDLQIQFNHESEEFAIYLRKNEHLVTSGTVVEWHYPNGTKQLSKLTTFLAFPAWNHH